MDGHMTDNKEAVETMPFTFLLLPSSYLCMSVAKWVYTHMLKKKSKNNSKKIELIHTLESEQ